MLKTLFSANRQASTSFIVITVFLDVLGIGLIIPVLPALVGQFTSSPDEQAQWYGWLSATYGVVQFFCTPILGALSDRFGRRPILLLSILGLGTSLLVQATATSLLAMLLIRIVSGATGASFSVANAYIADVTPPEQRGKAFGKLGAAFGMGFIFGPVLGGLLGGHDVRLPFFVAAGMALVNLMYGYFVLPESLSAERRAPFSLKRANPFSALMHLSQLHGVGGLIGVFALTVFAQFILQSTWVLYTQFRFGWDPMQNGFALFLVGVVSAVVQGGLQGRLIKRFGEKKLALMGMTSGAVALLLYGLANQGWMMYCIIFGNLLSAAAGPAMQAIVSRAVGPREQGLTQGSLTAINSVAIIFAPLLGTAILARVGHLPQDDWRIGSTFLLCAVLQVVAIALAVAHFRRMHRGAAASAEAQAK
jgi:DHA1 family tetracycline resistance protein-like MFS transporter